MNRDQFEELAAMHALGLLEGEEKRIFEEQVRADPQARDIAVRLGIAASAIALTADQVEPPARLRDRVMAALPDRSGVPSSSQTQAQSQSSAVASALSGTAASTPARDDDKVVAFRWVPWALAASLALVCGLVVKSNLALRERVATAEKAGATLRDAASTREAAFTSAQNQLARAAQESAELRSLLATAEKARKIDALRVALLESQLKDTPDARAIAVWNGETQEGLFTVANLPPAPAGKDYQLWIVDPKYPTPVDGGVFNTAKDGTREYRFRANHPVAAANVFAVSLEDKGGVPVAKGPMVLVGK